MELKPGKQNLVRHADLRWKSEVDRHMGKI